MALLTAMPKSRISLTPAPESLCNHAGILITGNMCYAVGMADEPTQLDKFKALARDVEADEDEARWDERLKKVAKSRPVEATPKK